MTSDVIDLMPIDTLLATHREYLINIAKVTAQAYLALSARQAIMQHAQSPNPHLDAALASTLYRYAVDYWARPLAEITRAYGPAAILGELRHATTQLCRRARKYPHTRHNDICDSCPVQLLCRDYAEIYRSLGPLSVRRSLWQSGEARRQVYRAAPQLLRHWPSIPDFLQWAEDVFASPWWKSDFGGQSWALIARTLRLLWDEPDPIIVADVSVNLAHNTSQWLSKICDTAWLTPVASAKAKARDLLDLCQLIDRKTTYSAADLVSRLPRPAARAVAYALSLVKGGERVIPRLSWSLWSRR